MIVSVGIDVAKDKHDCFILNSEGKVLADVFTVPNNMDGFNRLLQTIRDCTTPQDIIKVGLEATGHYSYNILGFLLDNGLSTYAVVVVLSGQRPRCLVLYTIEKNVRTADLDTGKGCHRAALLQQCAYAVLDTSGAVCVRPQPLRLVQQKLLTGAVIRDSRRRVDGVNVVQRQIQFSA